MICAHYFRALNILYAGSQFFIYQVHKLGTGHFSANDLCEVLQ